MRWSKITLQKKWLAWPELKFCVKNLQRIPVKRGVVNKLMRAINMLKLITTRAFAGQTPMKTTKISVITHQMAQPRKTAKIRTNLVNMQMAHHQWQQNTGTIQTMRMPFQTGMTKPILSKHSLNQNSFPPPSTKSSLALLA